MVTHVPSPSASSASLSTITGSLRSHHRRSSSRTKPATSVSSSSRHAPSSYRAPANPYQPNIFPPSPPSSHSYASSPPSSYVAPRIPEEYARSRPSNSHIAPSVAESRATEAARQARHRNGAQSQSQAEYRRHGRRSGSRANSITSTSTGEEQDEQQNEYPWFGRSGDVEILLKNRDGRTEKRYKLHNLILRQNSKWWDNTLDGVIRPVRPPVTAETSQLGDSIHPDKRGKRVKSTLSARSSRGPSERLETAGETSTNQYNEPRWRFNLDWTSAASQEGFPMLVARPVNSPEHSPIRAEPSSSRGRPPASSHSFFRNLKSRRSSRHSCQSSNSSTTSHPNPSSTTIVPVSSAISEEDTDILNAYASIFSMMYNHSPALDSNSLPDAYVQSKTVLRLSALYSALDIARPRVEHHLLHFNRALYSNIARYPPSYLKLGHLLHSRKIFGEALVHVVGQWPVHEKYLADVDERVRDLIDDKHDELLEMRNKVDGRLFRLQLRTGRGDRVGPDTNFLDWLAMCLFREWLASQTATTSKNGILKPSQDSPRGAPKSKPTAPITGRPYHLMAQGGETYLSRSELKHFLKHQAPVELYSREGLKKLERRMDEIKAQARDCVRGLSRSFLEGELPRPANYLMCTRIEDRDFEWVWGS